MSHGNRKNKEAELIMISTPAEVFQKLKDLDKCIDMDKECPTELVEV